MTKLVWGKVGERLYETGLDRGVLFVDTVGFAWNGLTAVNETPSGGDSNPFFYDGLKYRQVASSEDFSATVEAFSAPSQFDICDGTASVSNGLYATQQIRRPFGLSYRTRIGNDLAGVDFAYKIHIIYNCLAAPSQQANASISNSLEPSKLSWVVSTVPAKMVGFKPTSHFIIDSRYASTYALGNLEAILYGTAGSPPRLLPASELKTLFS